MQSDIDSWAELYPAVNVIQELRKMKGWINSNPKKRKTEGGIKRFVNSWLAREQDRGGTSYGANYGSYGTDYTSYGTKEQPPQKQYGNVL